MEVKNTPREERETRLEHILNLVGLADCADKATIVPVPTYQQVQSRSDYMGECAVWGGSRQSVRKSSGSSVNTSSESGHGTGHDRISSGSLKSLQTARA
jgi:hypothetical protein